MNRHHSGAPEKVQALDTYTKLLRATGSVKARIDAHQTAGDLSDSQFGALEMLFHLGPLQQKAIGQKLLVSKSNVVAVIDKLEAQGLVERQRSTEDRRCVFVHLTGKGRDLVQELFPDHAATIVEEMGCLSAPEQKELGRLCRKLGLKEQA
jgi:MarR family 2-MHQ and catechol resistance regulon transcriptional repressor